MIITVQSLKGRERESESVRPNLAISYSIVRSVGCYRPLIVVSVKFLRL